MIQLYKYLVNATADQIPYFSGLFLFLYLPKSIPVVPEGEEEISNIHSNNPIRVKYVQYDSQ